MKIVKVAGTNNRHKVFVYALSTCAWCKKAKKYLQDNNVEFEYVDVDLCTKEDTKEIETALSKKGLKMVFPTVLVDDSSSIVGFREDKLAEALK
jgi:glutaredoxin